MEASLINEYYHFVYDPQLYGFNTAYWRELDGTASLSASNRIRVKSVAIASKHQYFRGDFIYKVNVPTAPSGAYRRIGLLMPGVGTSKNAAYFEIVGGVLRAVTVSNTGLETTSTITWDDAWTGVAVEFRIHWQRSRVVFYVGGLKVAEFDDRNTLPGHMPLSVFIQNNENDNMDVSYAQISFAEKVVQAEWETDATGSVENRTVESTSDNVVITESATVRVSDFVSASDAIAITESVTVVRS